MSLRLRFVLICCVTGSGAPLVTGDLPLRDCRRPSARWLPTGGFPWEEAVSRSVHLHEFGDEVLDSAEDGSLNPTKGYRIFGT